MDTFKRILKGIFIGFFSLVILAVVLALLLGEEETTAPVVQEQATLGIYVIDGDDSLFDGYSDPTVKIWSSEVEDTLSDNRELVTKIERGTEVELLQHGSDNWYCKIRHGNVDGWLACEWLRR